MTWFTDTFNRADAASLGAGWNLFGTGWRIYSNAAGLDATTAQVALYATPATSDDHASEVKITVVAGTHQGVVARCGAIGTSDTNTGAYYVFRYSGTACQIFKKAANVSTLTAVGTPATLTVVAGDVLRIEAAGAVIRGLVNGMEVTSYTDPSPIVGNRNVGLRSQGSTTSRYDDWAGGDLADDPAGPPPATLAAPTGLSAVPASSTRIDVSWNAVTGATGYELEINGGSALDIMTGRTYADEGLAASTTRSYRVRAYDAEGPGSWSSAVSATTPAAEPEPEPEPTPGASVLVLQRLVAGVWTP